MTITGPQSSLAVTSKIPSRIHIQIILLVLYLEYSVLLPIQMFTNTIMGNYEIRRTVGQRQCYKPCPMRMQSHGWGLESGLLLLRWYHFNPKQRPNRHSKQPVVWMRTCMRDMCITSLSVSDTSQSVDTSAYCGSCANISLATGRILGYEWHIRVQIHSIMTWWYGNGFLITWGNLPVTRCQ